MTQVLTYLKPILQVCSIIMNASTYYHLHPNTDVVSCSLCDRSPVHISNSHSHIYIRHIYTHILLWTHHRMHCRVAREVEVYVSLHARRDAISHHVPRRWTRILFLYYPAGLASAPPPLSSLSFPFLRSSRPHVCTSVYFADKYSQVITPLISSTYHYVALRYRTVRASVFRVQSFIILSLSTAFLRSPSFRLSPLRLNSICSEHNTASRSLIYAIRLKGLPEGRYIWGIPVQIDLAVTLTIFYFFARNMLKGVPKKYRIRILKFCGQYHPK